MLRFAGDGAPSSSQPLHGRLLIGDAFDADLEDESAEVWHAYRRAGTRGP